MANSNEEASNLCYAFLIMSHQNPRDILQSELPVHAKAGQIVLSLRVRIDDG